MAEQKNSSGVATIVGRPNTGKSTLLNTILGEKISIVSSVAQTTRYNIRGVLTDKRGQIVFIDTPGMHLPRNRMGTCLVRQIDDAIDSCDVIIHLVDVTEAPGEEENLIVGKINKTKARIIVGLNKIDLKAVFLTSYIQLWEQARGKSIQDLTDELVLMPLSALRGTNVEALVEQTFAFLPKGAQLYPADVLSDFPQRLAIADIIREKLFVLLHKEVPYSIGVYVDEFQQRSKTLAYIHAVILVERSTQRMIVLGKGGQMLKEVGQRARSEIETLLEKKVFLESEVKVKPGWQQDPAILKELALL
jgi:GTPase